MMNCKTNILLGLVALSSLLPIGCGEDELSDEAFGVIDLTPFYVDPTNSNPTSSLPRQIEPKKGYGRGAEIEYYDFGAQSDVVRQASGTVVIETNPMYFFFDKSGNPLLMQPQIDERKGLWFSFGGDPTYGPNQDRARADLNRPYSVRPKQLVVDPRRKSSAHQRPIVDKLKGGLWEIVEITAPDGYVPDRIKSWDTLKKGVDDNKFKLVRTGTVINCPMLDDRQEIFAPRAGYNVPRPRIDVWYRTKLGSCFLANGWASLAGNDGQLLPAGAPRPATFPSILRTRTSGVDQLRSLTVPTGRFYLPTADYGGGTKRSWWDGIIADVDPTNTATFSPVLQTWEATVPGAGSGPQFEPGGFKSEADIDPTLRKESGGGTLVRNLVVLGTPPDCGAKANGVCSAFANCADKGLSCNQSTCKCDWPRLAGFGEYCGRGISRCKTKEDLEAAIAANPADEGARAELAFAPAGFACHQKTPRGICYVACNGDAVDVNEGKDASGLELDSRCNNLPGFTCKTPSDVDKAKESVCVRGCSTSDTQAKQQASCNGSSLVKLPRKDVAPGEPAPVEDRDLGVGLTCAAIANVTACSYDQTLEPR